MHVRGLYAELYVNAATVSPKLNPDPEAVASVGAALSAQFNVEAKREGDAGERERH